MVARQSLLKKALEGIKAEIDEFLSAWQQSNDPINNRNAAFTEKIIELHLSKPPKYLSKEGILPYDQERKKMCEACFEKDFPRKVVDLSKSLYSSITELNKFLETPENNDTEPRRQIAHNLLTTLERETKKLERNPTELSAVQKSVTQAITKAEADNLAAKASNRTALAGIFTPKTIATREQLRNTLALVSGAVNRAMHTTEEALSEAEMPITPNTPNTPTAPNVPKQ